MERTVKERWSKPVIRIGVWTNLVGIVLMLLPGLWVATKFDAWIGWAAFRRSFATILVYFGVNWFIEPISYFPPIGAVGTYMGWLGGSITSAKIPAAAAARELLDVKDGTQESEVVTVYAMYGAQIANIVILTLIAVFGSFLLKLLPAGVRAALANYVMPSLFGSMLAMFGCELPMLLIPCFLVMIVVYILLGKGLLPSGLSTWLPLIAVIGAIALARLLYKKGLLFKGRTK